MKKIIVPIPTYGFDPSEVSIPWKIWTAHGIDVFFATPNGTKAIADLKMVTGESLGIWKRLLMARKDAVDAYNDLLQNIRFQEPLPYSAIIEEEYDALLLPGGHDKSVKEYLESPLLQKVVVDFFKKEKTVAAICHGVVLAARSINPDTQKSVLYNYTTTALLKSQELTAYNLTRLWLKDYYLTYPNITVQDEVTAALADKQNFKTGPTPIKRDGPNNLKSGFVQVDRNYISARWPGDLYNFSYAVLNALKVPLVV